MKYQNLKCNNCGAELHLDIDNGIAFCPYCGAQVYADYSDSILIEKEKTKRARLKFDTETSKAKNKLDETSKIENGKFLSHAIIFLLWLILLEFLFILTIIEEL